MIFNLKRPCANCPFLRTGAIDLMPGRVEGIIESLRNDYNTFPCHKTTHGQKPRGKESACMGATAYMFRETGRLSILARLATRDDSLRLEDIEACYPLLLEKK